MKRLLYVYDLSPCPWEVTDVNEGPLVDLTSQTGCGATRVC
jgi:hypothetical protein